MEVLWEVQGISCMFKDFSEFNEALVNSRGFHDMSNALYRGFKRYHGVSWRFKEACTDSRECSRGFRRDPGFRGFQNSLED